MTKGKAPSGVRCSVCHRYGYHTLGEILSNLGCVHVVAMCDCGAGHCSWGVLFLAPGMESHSKTNKIPRRYGDILETKVRGALGKIARREAGWAKLEAHKAKAKAKGKAKAKAKAAAAKALAVAAAAVEVFGEKEKDDKPYTLGELIEAADGVEELWSNGVQRSPPDSYYLIGREGGREGGRETALR